MIKPIHDKILVRRIAVEEKTAGGIIIPGAEKEKPDTGEVLSVGNGHRNANGSVSPLEVKIGDKIVFNKFSGSEVRVDGEELLLMEEDRVLGIFQ